MSITSDELVRRAAEYDPALAADFQAFAKSREYGLVFEHNRPEAMRLYGKPIVKGDTVHRLPERGEREKAENREEWKVVKVADGLATLTKMNDTDTTTKVPVEDVVAIAAYDEPIYAGLKEVGRVERGGDKPYHVVIKGENYHALEALLFAYAGKVDCIYIDPPYNTGARDWKYNNDYVEGTDEYRHSKWLALMERRLVLAKQLLNPQDSVLIVTIDEKEQARLGLLIEQMFTGCVIQMVTIVHNPGGAIRVEGLNRINEYAYYVFIGSSSPSKTERDMTPTSSDEQKGQGTTGRRSPIWRGLLRGGANPLREHSPLKFYPILVDDNGKVVGCGDPLPLNMSIDQYETPEGLLACWPIKRGGVEGRWELKKSTFEERLGAGYVKAGDLRSDGTRTIYYLRNAEIERLNTGELVTDGMNELGYLDIQYNDERGRATIPRTVWNTPRHNATEYGSNLNKLLLGNRRFPYPKSLYAVEDSLSFMLDEKPKALVLDFFAGSGTTAHAVMRLNHQDGGTRRSISITNNEVGANEIDGLTREGLRQGDSGWEQYGICEYITKPRISAAIDGKTPDGEPINGDYKFTDEFPMADGFEENAIFFDLTYQDPVQVDLDQAFEEIAPLLWLRAGCECSCTVKKQATENNR